jgi:FtsP/CotA-like multicopper oxidase with cupredoxin domain
VRFIDTAAGLALPWNGKNRSHSTVKAAAVVLGADNPGIWMMDCHNTHHQEVSMMTSLTYTT